MKNFNYYFLCGIALIMLAACGSSSSKNEEEKITETGANGKEYRSYQEACRAEDFEAARDTMSIYHKKYLEELSGHWFHNSEERTKAEGKYYEAFDYIYKAEIQYLLSELRGDECKDKILFILEEIPIEGEKFPQGICGYSVARRGSAGEEGLPLDAYIKWTQHYNRLCDNILSLAINRKNQDLAKLILLKYVDNVEVTEGDSDGGVKVNGVTVDGYHGYIKYTNADRDAAKKKYDEAVELGAFN